MRRGGREEVSGGGDVRGEGRVDGRGCGACLLTGYLCLDKPAH